METIASFLTTTTLYPLITINLLLTSSLFAGIIFLICCRPKFNSKDGFHFRDN